jgi:transposase
VLKQLRRALGGQKATLLWNGLGAHRSRAMRAFLAIQRDWLVTERLPAYAPDLNPVGGLWANLKGQELANLACDTLGEVIQATRQGIQRIRQAVVAAVLIPAAHQPLGVMTPPHQDPNPSRS